jgi:hypothetical protein
MPTRRPHSSKNLPAEAAAVQAAHRGQAGAVVVARRSALWPAGHARPGVGRHRRTAYHYTYLWGAVCPQTGETNAWLMSVANIEAMPAQWDHLSRQLLADVHALLVLDQAGWHTPRAA